MKHRTFSLDRVPSQGEGGSPLPVSLPYPPPFVNAFLKKSLGISGSQKYFRKNVDHSLVKCKDSADAKKLDSPLTPLVTCRTRAKKIASAKCPPDSVDVLA